MREATLPQIVEKSVNMWLDGVQNEINYWNSWFQHKGARWKDDYLLRTQGKIKIASYNDEFIDYTDKNFRVLDAGSGPISSFGTEGSGGKIQLTACDALADIYAILLKNFRIVPYCQTEYGCFEGLAQIYGMNFFDYIHARNSLDHSFDPLLGLYNLILVVKKGGYIQLRHADNEAERENYNGLHQWNLTIENSEFFIWNKSIRYNITQLFQNCCDFSYRQDAQSNNHVVIIRKNVDYLPFEMQYNSFYLINKCLIKKAFEHIATPNETSLFQNLRKQFQAKHASAVKEKS